MLPAMTSHEAVASRTQQTLHPQKPGISLGFWIVHFSAHPSEDVNTPTGFASPFNIFLEIPFWKFVFSNCFKNCVIVIGAVSDMFVSEERSPMRVCLRGAVTNVCLRGAVTNVCLRGAVANVYLRGAVTNLSNKRSPGSKDDVWYWLMMDGDR